MQCEACHGPMELHVGQASAATARRVRPDPGRPVTEAVCVRCHDAQNSPKWEKESYFEAVAHPSAR